MATKLEENQLIMWTLLKALPIIMLVLAMNARAQDLIVPVNNLTDLQACINISGDATHQRICLVSSVNSPYDVTQPLIIRGSYVTILGNTTWGRESVTLRRAATAPGLTVIIWAPDPVANVELKEFFVDGNRYESGLSCQPANGAYTDVSLIAATSGIVSIDIWRSPNGALMIGGEGQYRLATTVFVVNTNITGARDTGIWLAGHDNGVWYSTINIVGTAAINVQGTTQYIYGNSLGRNRFEQPDNINGGQILLDENSTRTFVARNGINGDYWITTASTSTDGVHYCPTTPGLLQSGIEVAGHEEYFNNNAIIQEVGTGIQVNPGAYQIAFSGYNPWVPNDVKFYIDHNINGIGITDSAGPDPLHPALIMFDGIRITNSFDYHKNGISQEGWGIQLTNVPAYEFRCSPGTECTAPVYMCGNTRSSPSPPAAAYSSVHEDNPVPPHPYFPLSNEYTGGDCHTGSI